MGKLRLAVCDARYSLHNHIDMLDYSGYRQAQTCDISLTIKRSVPAMTDIKIKHSHNFVNITNQRFGRWVAIKYIETIKKRSHWLCECDCGVERIIDGHYLRHKKSKSCGCLRIDKGIKQLRKKLEYGVWHSMKQRCLNSKNRQYPNYGGRGITICDRWLNSFENFLADMGKRTSDKHSIDRIDNNGNYEPSNCRWATASEQCMNRRTNVFVEVDNIKMILEDACKLFDINSNTVGYRLKIGMDIKTALTKPLQRKSKNASH